MRKVIKKLPFTALAVTCGLVLLGMGLLFKLELWENLVKFIARGEAFELDEFIIPIFLLMIGITADALLIQADQKKMEEKVSLYNQMNEQILDEISTHLTKMLEFRTALMRDVPKAHDVRHELDRMIVKSFNHYERAQRRGNIDSSLIDLVMQDSNKSPLNSLPPENDSLNSLPTQPKA